MLKKVIPAYWHRSVNFGDQLTPYIIEKVTGEEVCYCDHLNDCPRLMCTGSILADPHVSKAIIWGNGFAYKADPVYAPLKILAVRGQLTRQKFIESGIDCPEVYGDPGLLVPELFEVASTPDDHIGVVPHIIDLELMGQIPMDKKGLRIIDLTAPIETVLNQIYSCKKIISSSLHGLVVAHAYGIPAAQVKFSDRILGDGFKYMDYCQSVEVPYQEQDCTRVMASARLNYHVPTNDKLTQLRDGLNRALSEYIAELN
jgi:pyruvyltransferase